MPAVSLVMACYDTGEPLSEALDSVARQTCDDYELLVVDDGSTDARTLEILARERPRMRVIRQPHQGVIAARNHALSLTEGRYLSFFDSDDRLRPRFLEALVPILDENPAKSFVSFWLTVFGDEHWEWQPERIDLDGLLRDCSIATAALVRREAVLEVGGFDPAMEQGHEDWDLWLSLSARGHEGLLVREPLFEYRRRAGSRSVTADAPEAWMATFRARLAKHHACFEARRQVVLRLQAEELEAERRAIAEARRHIAEDLLPALGRAPDEIAADDVDLVAGDGPWEELLCARESRLRRLLGEHRALERRWRALDAELAARR
jgi:glycosyltransferase involved in cell wall biosynthesis